MNVWESSWERWAHCLRTGILGSIKRNLSLACITLSSRQYSSVPTEGIWAPISPTGESEHVVHIFFASLCVQNSSQEPCLLTSSNYWGGSCNWVIGKSWGADRQEDLLNTPWIHQEACLKPLGSSLQTTSSPPMGSLNVYSLCSLQTENTNVMIRELVQFSSL